MRNGWMEKELRSEDMSRHDETRIRRGSRTTNCWMEGCERIWRCVLIIPFHSSFLFHSMNHLSMHLSARGSDSRDDSNADS